MNQPQQLNVSFDFNGYLVCQMPPDIVEVELKIRTKWGKFILLKDFHTGQRNISPGVEPANKKGSTQGQKEIEQKKKDNTILCPQIQVPL